MYGTEVKVPTLGESITEATIGEWLKQPGDAVRADEPIASLETDKVAVEVNAPPSPAPMGQQLVKPEGDTVAGRRGDRQIEAGGARQLLPPPRSLLPGRKPDSPPAAGSAAMRQPTDIVARGAPRGAGTWPRSARSRAPARTAA